MQTEFYVHESTIIDENVSIGPGCKIWHFNHLSSGCRLGANCILGQNVFVGKDVSIGRGVKIQNNVSVFSGVELEDEVFLGPSMVFTNVINPRAFIERKDAFRKTIVRRGATIGANATILCGIEIGSFALIGAGAVVTRSVPAHALITGNPGRQAGWVSRSGNTLKFDKKGRGICPDSGKTYLLLRDQLIVPEY